MVVNPHTRVGGFKLFSWRFFYWRLFLDIYAGVFLTATVLQTELWVRAVGLGTCWTPWVPGGVLCKEQSQITATAAREGLGQPGVSAGIRVFSERMPELCLSHNTDSKEVIWILPLALHS